LENDHNIEVVDSRSRPLEIKEDEPEITKDDLIEKQIEDWKYIK